ncbi:HAMP domain-containing sensor histidine kinase [Aliikangiella maris]
MSFRKASLIFITLLLTSILLIQWWSITNFTHDISSKIGKSAFEVSRSTAETLIFKQPKIEIHSIELKSTNSVEHNQLASQQLQQILTQVREDVTIQLKNEQEDNYLLFNADGFDYKIPIPRTGIDIALDKFSQKVFYSTVILLLIGIILSIYFTQKIARPLKGLQSASTKIGKGNFGIQIKKEPYWHSKEILQTIDSFNQMSKQIESLQIQNTHLQNQAYLAELSEISKSLAHTIRNPLNTLNLAIDQLENATLQADRTKLAKLAKNQIRRIDNWIRSLMDMMNNDASPITTVQLNQLLADIIQEQLTNNTKRVQIQLNLDQQTDYKIQAIQTELKSLFQSLIVNAIEASPDSGEIAIALKMNNNQAIITITDQGPGFSKPILDNLFTPHNTNKTYGAGMGLYLAQKIIRNQYQGEITINNLSPKGCILTVTLNNRG